MSHLDTNDGRYYVGRGEHYTFSGKVRVTVETWMMSKHEMMSEEWMNDLYEDLKDVVCPEMYDEFEIVNAWKEGEEYGVIVRIYVDVSYECKDDCGDDEALKEALKEVVFIEYDDVEDCGMGCEIEEDDW